MPHLFTVIDGTMYKLEEVEPADYLDCCWDFCEDCDCEDIVECDDDDDDHYMDGGVCSGVCVDGETGGLKTNYEFMEKMQGAFEHAEAKAGDPVPGMPGTIFLSKGNGIAWKEGSCIRVMGGKNLYQSLKEAGELLLVEDSPTQLCAGLAPFEAGPDTDNLPHARHRFSWCKAGDEITFQVPGEVLRKAKVIETLDNGAIRVEFEKRDKHPMEFGCRRLLDPQDMVDVFRVEPEKEHCYGT